MAGVQGRDGRGARQRWLRCKARWLDRKAGIVTVKGRGGLGAMRDGWGARQGWPWCKQDSCQVKLCISRSHSPGEAPGAHRSVCFCKWNMWTSVLPLGWEPPLLGAWGGGGACYIRPIPSE